MPNLHIIKELCEKRNISLKGLANLVGISEVGLQRIIKKNSTTVGTLEKIAFELNAPISQFFDPSPDGMIMREFFNSSQSIMLRNRLNKLTDKLSLLKDLYIWELVNMTVNNGYAQFPLIYDDGPIFILSEEVFDKIMKFSETIPYFLETPYSKMGEEVVKEFKSHKPILEAFYYILFYTNTLSIVDYLNDNLIKDEEVIYFWNSRKLIEDKIGAVAIW